MYVIAPVTVRHKLKSQIRFLNRVGNIHSKYNTLYTNIKNILLILNRKQKIKSIILVILIFGITLIELICIF